jgi:predicted TPR repeat methyltransferase
MSAIATVLSVAFQQHQAGNLAQAESLYRQVLTVDPQCANAWHLLALICQVQGRMTECVALYQRCLELQPDSAEAHNNLGVAYAAQHRLTEALACYRQAVALKPDYAEAFNNLALANAWQKNWEQTIDCCRRALAVQPNYPEALTNLGIAYYQQQRLDEAGDCFRQALALRPDYLDALNNLGNVCLAQNKSAAAVGMFLKVLRSRPNDPRTNNNLAVAYRTLHQYPEAIACLQTSLAANATDPATHRNLGFLYHDQEKFPEALSCFEQVLALVPDDVDARLMVDVLRGTAQLTRLPPEHLVAFYDGFAPRFEKDLVERRGYCSPQWLREALEPAPPPRSLEVLDLGCGTGLCGVQFRNWAATLTGVDLSANMLAQARQRGLYDELIHGDVLAPLQTAEGKYDLIVASDVLLLLGDLEPVMQMAQRGLRPGGRFAFTLETHNGEPDYRLLPVLNFTHSPAYLRKVAEAHRLQVTFMKDVLFPREERPPVPGMVVVLTRSLGR